MAKAIDYEEYDRVPRGATLVSRPTPPLFGLGITEALAVITLTYFVCVAFFNIGYFSKVDGKFSDLFSLYDLLGSNLAVFGYIYSMFGLYCIFSVAFRYLGHPTTFKNLVEARITNLGSRQLTTLSVLLVAMALILSHLMFEETYFTIEMIPVVIMFGILMFIDWVGYKYERIKFHSFIASMLVGIVGISYMSGRLWIKYEIATPSNAQALIMSDGLCHNRTVLRSGSNGVLLYNSYLKEFELRSRDTIKTIFQRPTCS